MDTTHGMSSISGHTARDTPSKWPPTCAFRSSIWLDSPPEMTHQFTLEVYSVYYFVFYCHPSQMVVVAGGGGRALKNKMNSIWWIVTCWHWFRKQRRGGGDKLLFFYEVLQEVRFISEHYIYTPQLWKVGNPYYGSGEPLLSNVGGGLPPAPPRSDITEVSLVSVPYKGSFLCSRKPSAAADVARRPCLHPLRGV